MVWKLAVGITTVVLFSIFYREINMINGTCNSQCGCNENVFSPMCGPNGVSYISPCHAGCHTKEFSVNDTEVSSTYWFYTLKRKMIRKDHHKHFIVWKLDANRGVIFSSWGGFDRGPWQKFRVKFEFTWFSIRLIETGYRNVSVSRRVVVIFFHLHKAFS